METVPADSQSSTLEQLITGMLRHLEELGYSASTRENYERVWARLSQFARAHLPACTRVRDLGPPFLASCGILPGKRDGLTPSQKLSRRALRILIEFQEMGRFRCQEQRIDEPYVPKLLAQAQERYEAFCNHHLRYRAATLNKRHRVVTAFLAFLGSRGVTSPSQLQTPVLVGYITERGRQLRARSLAAELGGVRSFLRFLSMRGLVAPELVAQVRALRLSKEHRLPPVWPPETVEALLNAVDRSSPVGKRTYAILLLAAHLGLRASDIRALQLEDLHWAEARLDLRQAKTGGSLSLPLSEPLGQALIDYLRHARPQTHHREVFLKVRAPHEPLGPHNNLYGVIASTLARIDIALPEGMPRGLHSLRHTLATRLVLTGQRLETVAAILGHRSIESTRIYTHLDLDALRTVALDPEELCHG